MAEETIRFHRVEGETDLVAVAEVSLFEGVYLRGWHILRRGARIEVLPPHKVYRDPDTGEERTFDLLHFENDGTRRQWLSKLREEYVKWSSSAEPSRDAPLGS